MKCKIVMGLFVVVIAALFCMTGCSKQESVNTQPEQSAPAGSQSVVGRSLDAGKSSQCRSQLTQLRQGVESYRVNTGTEENPSTLADVNLGVSADFYKCPVSGQPYSYDPTSGLIQCINPQHVKY